MHTLKHLYNTHIAQYLDSIFLLIIIIQAFIIRILFLDTIPPNIAGDEVTNLSYVYKILFGNGQHPFSLMGDGSMAGVQFYFIAFVIKIVGLSHAIFGLRLSFVILSVFSLIPFYLLLKHHTSSYISFFATTLLSVNYVFLNFSRTAWTNMGTICFGLWMMYCLENGIHTKKKLWFFVAGIFAGLTLYGYHYGRILFVIIVLYLFIYVLYKKSKTLFIHFLIFLGTTALLFLPFLFTALLRQDSFLARPTATYVFSAQKIQTNEQFINVFTHQLTYTIRGLLIFDPQVMSDGIENQRYTPPFTPPINIVIQLFFTLGLLYILYQKKKIWLWICVGFSTFLILFLTDLPPNFSRGLFYVPFIYFIVGFFLYTLQKKLSHKNQKIITICIAIISLPIVVQDLRTYFVWMNTQALYEVRQPAIDYSEFTLWQKYQIDRVKNNLEPITNYEWYEVRKTLPVQK